MVVTCIAQLKKSKEEPSKAKILDFMNNMPLIANRSMLSVESPSQGFNQSFSHHVI